MSQSVGTGGGTARDLCALERVLVIEDDVLALRSLEKTLREEGFQVHSARTIDAAKKLIAEEEFDAALVDLLLDGAHATGLITELRTAKRPCFAVMITGSSRTVAAREALAAGAEDFLVKPVQNEELFKAIRKTVERTRMWRGQVEEIEVEPEVPSPRLSVVVDRPADGSYGSPPLVAGSQVPAASQGARRSELPVPTDSTPRTTKLLAWPPLRTLKIADIERCADGIAEIGGLTDRERKILVPLLRGEQNDEIAQLTGASRRTVKFHVSNILKKLRITQRAELVRFLF